MARDDNGYADLRDYAIIGNGRTIALVALDGRIDWLPLPDLDSRPVFAAILDSDSGGYLDLAPTEQFTAERCYLPGTGVLTTTFRTASGCVRITDSLNSGVAGPLPWSELARTIEGIEGHVHLQARVEPGTRLNTASPYTGSIGTTARILRCGSLGIAVQAHGESAIAWGPSSVTISFDTAPGTSHLLALIVTDNEPLYIPSSDSIRAGVQRTITNWTRWSETLTYDGMWADEVRRSAIVLKQLIRVPTGAMAAAATVALPESSSGHKNWDYRLAWVRDTAYSLTALMRFGLREEVHAAITWQLKGLRERHGDPRIMYQLNGQQPDGARTRDVPGWRGIGPVIEGNRAAGQLQLGVFGDLFSIVRLYVDDGNLLDAATARSLSTMADLVCDRWRSKDSGMWELTEQRHYTTSKLGCWQALKHAVHLAKIGHVSGPHERWQAEARNIKEWVEENAWDPDRGTYIWYPGTDALDASILLHAISGFDRSEKMLSTIRTLQRQLGRGDDLYRYSGARQEEGAFTACAFWAVSALYLCNQQAEATDLMNRLVRTQPNDAGILAEMSDTTGAFLGNLPQALSHLALINAAITTSGL